MLRDAATEQVVRRNDPRVRVIPVAGTSYRTDALQDDAFAPGRPLALVPEPDNEHDPNAIGVWDAERRVQAGYVPAEVARDLVADEWQAVSLVEFSEGDKRAGLRVLLAPRDAWIGMPRA
jgi:HIRAN domain